MTTKLTPSEIRAELDFRFYEGRAYPTGPSKEHPLMTSGVARMMELCQAGWLIDRIATAQFDPPYKDELFQVWKLVIRSDKSAELICDDGDGHVISHEEIKYTDFPLSEGISLFMTNSTIMLPSEY